MKTGCEGFTLIEMAIVIIILGLAIAGIAPIYDLYKENQNIEKNEVNVNVSISAIGTFRSLYGRYPCPASPTLTREDPNYGREDCTDKSTVNQGFCSANGICVERSRRAAFPHEYPADKARNEQPRVLVGTLPFRNLNLEENQGYDSYGHRLMYVVTENLTCDECFTRDGGGIDIIDDSGDTVLSETGAAHFVVMSYGKDGAGAYTKAGTQITCSSAGLENDNCDYDSNTVPDATYRVAQGSTSNSDNKYDDVIDYFTQDELPVWQLSKKQRLAMHQKSLAGDVAILKNDEDIARKGDVNGSIRATPDPNTDEDGKFLVNQLCNAFSGECFETSVIAGKIAEGDGLSCDTTGSGGKFMIGIEAGEPVCSDEVTSECPKDSLLAGVNNDGSLKCITPKPKNCGATSISMCDKIVSIPSGNHGSTFTAKAGASQTRIYKCDNGSWKIDQDVQGVCNCTPGPVSTTTVGCGTGFSGSAVRTVTRTCPDGTLTTTTDRGACACMVTDRFGTRACPAGHTGVIITKSTNTCPAGTWGPPVDVPGGNSCTCDNRTEERLLACPAGQVGDGIEQTRTVTCQPGGAVFGTWTETSRDCDCEDVTVTEPFPCDEGEMGSVLKKRTMNCKKGEWSTWVNVPGGNSCQPTPVVVCNWKKSSSGTGPYPFPSGANFDNSCECGKTKACYERVGSGQYLHYSSCTCQ